MAFSWSEESLPAGTTSVPVNIEYLDKSYIHLYLDDVETTNFTWASDTLIQLNSALTTATKVLLVRRTEKEYLYIAFSEGAAFIRENLDTQNTQFLHLAQEMTEGRSIEGFYGDLSMNGYRITHLGDGIDSADAVNKGQLDVVDNRVKNLENTFVNVTNSYPWYTVTTVATDTLVPGFSFDKAALYIQGNCQTPDYSYVVVDNTILLAETIPAGTLVFARLGEDVTDSPTAPIKRRKMEVLYSGLSGVTVGVAAVNLVGLVKVLSPTTGSLNAFFNQNTNKLNVYNDDATLLFKMNITGTWNPASSSPNSLMVRFSNSNGNFIKAFKSSGNDADTLQLLTYLSIDKGGAIATSGSEMTLSALDSDFNVTEIFITVEQVTSASGINPV